MEKHYSFNYVKEKSGKIRLYADENIEYSLITYLEDKKINVVSAKKLGHKGRDDDFQFKQAYKLKRFLLTCDQDFLNNKLFRFSNMVGVVVLDFPKTLPGTDHVLQLLTDEVIPSGKQIEGTKILIKPNSVDIFFVNKVGFVDKQTFNYSWHK